MQGLKGNNYWWFSLIIPWVSLEGCEHLISHVIPYLRHGVLAHNKIWRDNVSGNIVIPVITSPTSSGINFSYGMSIHVVLSSKRTIWLMYADEVMYNRASHWNHYLFLHRKKQSLSKNFKLFLQNPKSPIHTYS